MDRFEQKEMKKITPIKNAWNNQLMSYLSEPITKIVGGFKDKIAGLFKTNSPKHTVYGQRKKLRKSKKRIQRIKRRN